MIQQSTIKLFRQPVGNNGFVYLVRVRVANVQATFMLDTGCSSSIIDGAFYRLYLEQNFEPVPGDTVMSSLQSNADTRTWWHQFKQQFQKRNQLLILEHVPVSFGTLRRVLPVMHVTDLSHFGKPHGFNVDGLLGMDALEKFNALISINNDSMHIQCEQKGEALATA